MPCTVDLFNNPEQRKAAEQHIALLKHRGEWDDTPQDEQDSLVGTSTGYFYGHLRIGRLCAKIRGLGGTDYLKSELQENPTPEIAGVYSWYVDHERKDREEEKRRAKIRAEEELYLDNLEREKELRYREAYE